MSTTPASSVAALPSAESAPPVPTASEPMAANATKVAQAEAVADQSPATDEEGEFDEESHHFGRFVLFNAVPSSLVSGVIHFVGFLILALTTMSPPPPNETLAINAAPAEKTDKEELQN